MHVNWVTSLISLVSKTLEKEKPVSSAKKRDMNNDVMYIVIVLSESLS